MKKQARAFTLIELLVVIAIIGILAAILIPSMAKVRDNALTAKSISSLRQVGVAIDLFAQDNNNTLPGPTYTGIKPIYRESWAHVYLATMIGPYLGYSATDQNQQILVTELFPATWEGKIGDIDPADNSLNTFEANERDYDRDLYRGRPFGYPGGPEVAWSSSPLRMTQIVEPDSLWLLREAPFEGSDGVRYLTDEKRLYLWASGRVSIEEPDFVYVQ